MYHSIGEIVSRFAIFWIVFWIAFAAVAIFNAPPREEVWQDGEFIFLPDDLPSRQAEQLYREAFRGVPSADVKVDDESVGTSVQQDPLGSNIVIVLEREDRASGLTAQDREFISNVLLPKLKHIQQTTPRGYFWSPEVEASLTEDLPPGEQVIKSISTLADERIGPLLTSKDQKATLIILELRTEFLDRQNSLVLTRIENLVNDKEIQEQIKLGLAPYLSGSATVGRDMLKAESESASRTENFTKVLVIVLLLIIYRAPLLALVPLVTVGVAVEMTQALLRIMAGWGWIGLFTGLDVYVTVVVYGAGVDYCLFLIARYKEELDAGLSYPQAMSRSIRQVGAALATSAGTSIIGIGMMGFSEFGKFRQAGFAISFGLFLVLCFALTFTPAFLLIFGKWAFWPEVRVGEVRNKSGWLPQSNMWSKISDGLRLEEFWQAMANVIRRHPGTIFAVTILAMLPFAGVGVAFQDNLSYGLLSDLPQDETSVEGARAVQQHFPAGVTGPNTMFIRFDRDALESYLEGDDLTSLRDAEKLSEAITTNLQQHDGTLEIQDIRSQYMPLGTDERAQEYLRGLPLARRGAKRTFAHRTYTSLDGPQAGQVMRMDVVLNEDPFSREAISKLTKLEQAVRDSIPKELRDSAKIYSLGTTAGIRDLKTVTDHDRILIDVLVVVSVYIVLVILLRSPEICAYLIVSVVFSYLVTLGATFVVFYLRDPSGFTGIDWKVPIYLFTILIAMGEDYNILLMSRIKEEQAEHGYVGGVLHALMKTGSIISSCGVIMAGTFCTLMAGSLLGMVQMGFALAFGVLLDTFIVRPILVPAYLILLYSGKFGRVGRLLGAPADAGLTTGPAEYEESQAANADEEDRSSA